MRPAGKILRMTLEEMAAAVCPGVTTAEIDSAVTAPPGFRLTGGRLARLTEVSRRIMNIRS